jgi:excisionase family DNA binding protein
VAGAFFIPPQIFFLKAENCTFLVYIPASGHAIFLSSKGAEGGGMETYLTIAELAECIKLSEQTVRRYVLNKTVPYHKIQKVVRFRVSEIEKWIEAGGLGGAVKAGPEDDREGDLFAGLEAEKTGEAKTAAGEGDNTGGAA